MGSKYVNNIPPFSLISTLTLAPGEAYVVSLAVLGHYLYVGMATSPPKISKIDLVTFNEVAELNLPSVGETASSMVISGGFLYAWISDVPSRIVIVDLSTFTLVATVQLLIGYVNALAVSNGYLYAGCSGSPGLYNANVIQINLSTLAQTACQLNSTSVINTLIASGGYLYVGLETSPGQIAKISLSTFTQVATLVLNEVTSGPVAFAIVGNTLYVGCFYSSHTAGLVDRIDLPSFSETGSVTFLTNETEITAIAVFADYLYAVCGTSPGMIVKVELSSFTKLSTLTLPSGQNSPSAIVVFGCLIVGFDNSPGLVDEISF